jgi:hypothetical protein
MFIELSPGIYFLNEMNSKCYIIIVLVQKYFVSVLYVHKLFFIDLHFLPHNTVLSICLKAVKYGVSPF